MDKETVGYRHKRVLFILKGRELYTMKTVTHTQKELMIALHEGPRVDTAIESAVRWQVNREDVQGAQDWLCGDLARLY